MGDSTYTVNVDNKLAVITLNRPAKKNSLTQAMYNNIAKTLHELSEREDVAITAITGTGDFFTSGNDLTSAFSKLSMENLDEVLDKATRAVRAFVEAFITHKKVLVAVVNGPAIGIGATILPLCDIVYCTPNAWFQTPFSRLGLCAEGCSSYTFSKILGVSKANEMLLFNDKLTADDAAVTGFVARVVPRDKLEAIVWQPLRQNAAQLSNKSLEATKYLTRKFEEHTLHEANRAEIQQLNYLFRTNEAMESMMAFQSRRSKL